MKIDVVDQLGQPVDWATIELRNGLGFEVESSAKAASWLSSVRHGLYVIVASASGFDRSLSILSVHGHEVQARVQLGVPDVELSQRGVSGTVAGIDDSEEDEMWVVLVPLLRNGPLAEAMVARDGSYSIRGVIAGKYLLTVQRSPRAESRTFPEILWSRELFVRRAELVDIVLGAEPVADLDSSTLRALHDLR